MKKKRRKRRTPQTDSSFYHIMTRIHELESGIITNHQSINSVFEAIHCINNGIKSISKVLDKFVLFSKEPEKMTIKEYDAWRREGQNVRD